MDGKTDIQSNKGNFIAVTGEGVVVNSDNNTLENVEKCVNRIIKKHSRFIKSRERERFRKRISGVS